MFYHIVLIKQGSKVVLLCSPAIINKSLVSSARTREREWEKSVQIQEVRKTKIRGKEGKENCWGITQLRPFWFGWERGGVQLAPKT